MKLCNFKSHIVASLFLAFCAVSAGPLSATALDHNSSMHERLAMVAELCNGVSNFMNTTDGCARAMVKVAQQNASGPQLVTTACNQFRAVNVRAYCMLTGAEKSGRPTLVEGAARCREIKIGIRPATQRAAFHEMAECAANLLKSERDYGQSTDSSADPICLGDY